MGICMWSLLIIKPCSTCSYSDCSITACKANKPNITDHFHSFLAAKVDLPLANIEAEDLKSFEREKGGLIFNDYDGNDDGNDDNDDDDDNDNENNL